MPNVMHTFLKAMMVGLAAMAAISCAGDDQPELNQIQSVRVLATRVDKPYAAPGETVNLESLVVDGRKVKPEPMRMFWLPIPCKNPGNDLYYNCFSSFASSFGGGASGGPATPPPAGTDITAFLKEGTSYSFQMPNDAISSHAAVSGTAAPYGLVILFNIACAGSVRIVDPRKDTRQALPLGCFDKAGNLLGPDEFVFGFVRVFAYESIRNANPTIDAVSFGPTKDTLAPVDLTPGSSGIEVEKCTEEKYEKCKENALQVVVPEAAQEVNPLEIDPESSQPLKEQVWVSFYTSAGRFKSDNKLMYDTRSSIVGDNQNILWGPKNTPTDEVAEGRGYLVVRDSRGGANWVEFPIRVRPQ